MTKFNVLLLKSSVLYLALFYCYVGYFFSKNQYFPEPFYFDIHDTWMDFYNISFWSLGDEMYTKWKSFYSPLNFFLAKNLISQSCSNVADAFALRHCDLRGIYVYLLSFFILNTFLLLKLFKNTPNRWWWISLMMLSFPMMFGIERGNYFLLAMAAISMYLLTSSKIMQVIYLIVAICMKFYLIILIVPFWLKNKLWQLIALILFLLTIYTIFGIFINQTQWVRIPENIFSFGSNNSTWWIAKIYGSVSFSNLSTFSTYGFPSSLLSELIRVLTSFITVIVIARVWVFTAVAYDQNFNENLIGATLLLSIFILISSPGTYALVLTFPYIAYFMEKKIFHPFCQTTIILLCLPYPFKLFNVYTHTEETSFSEYYVEHIMNLPIQVLISPILLISLFYFFTKYNYSKGEINDNQSN